MNGAQVVLECLKEQGVDTIFGYPGGAVIPLYDALYDYNEFNHIRTSHEQGAVHAADGYARSTGKVGVCLATSGPGATNTITGIATAYMDSVPLVIITGQVATPLLGKDSFQEIDITGMTVSVTKHNYLVRKVEQIPRVIREAFNVAKSGRPGPVLVDIPKDIFLSNGIYEKADNLYENQKYTLDKEKILKALEIIDASKKPIIYAGGGVKSSGACDTLVNFAKKGDIPVVNTLMGLGTIKREDELSLGLVGMHGHRESNLAVTNSDLIIAVGARFSDRVISKISEFAPSANIIHIDIDACEIDKNIYSKLSLVGNLDEILKLLTNEMEKKDNSIWKEQINEWKSHDEINRKAFHPKNILNSFGKKLGDDIFVVTDVGQHQMWTAQHWKFSFCRSFITSGGLGTMGFGLGAAIGAKCANRDKHVLLVTGDGSFRMNCNELATVSGFNIPLIILLMNNQTLGMVRQWQKMFSNERYSQTDMDNSVDYVKLAKAYGIEGYKIDNINELDSLLNKIEFGNSPIFIECRVNKDENVYPIVPPGEPINNIIENWGV
jgi:acetolactate synthase I/II/III large subunit